KVMAKEPKDDRFNQVLMFEPAQSFLCALAAVRIVGEHIDPNRRRSGRVPEQHPASMVVLPRDTEEKVICVAITPDNRSGGGCTRHTAIVERRIHPAYFIRARALTRIRRRPV